MTSTVEHPLPLFLWLLVLSGLICGVFVFVVTEGFVERRRNKKAARTRPASAGTVRGTLKLDTTEWDRQLAAFTAKFDALPPHVRAAASAATTVDVRSETPHGRTSFDKHAGDALGLDA